MTLIDIEARSEIVRMSRALTDCRATIKETGSLKRILQAAGINPDVAHGYSREIGANRGALQPHQLVEIGMALSACLLTGADTDEGRRFATEPPAIAV